LLIALAHVGAHGSQDLVARHVNLRIEVGHAEATPAAAAGCHLHDAERGPLVWEQEGLATLRMRDVHLPGELLAAERPLEERQRVLGFAAPFDNAVHAQLFPGVGLRDLPAARSTHYHPETSPVRVPFDIGKQLPRVVRVDGLF
jgi:hypothetical protein